MGSKGKRWDEIYNTVTLANWKPEGKGMDGGGGGGGYRVYGTGMGSV